jgi:hypothetical protein
MHLNETFASQGAFTLSSPHPSYLSCRWLKANQTLLRSCALSSIRFFGTMDSTRSIHNCFYPWLIPPMNCTPPSCSYTTFSSYRRLQVPLLSQTWRDKGGSPSRTQSGIPTGHSRLSNPRQHHLEALHLHHRPHPHLRRSLVKVLAVSRPSPLSS